MKDKEIWVKIKQKFGSCQGPKDRDEPLQIWEWTGFKIDHLPSVGLGFSSDPKPDRVLFSSCRIDLDLSRTTTDTEMYIFLGQQDLTHSQMSEDSLLEKGKQYLYQWPVPMLHNVTAHCQKHYSQ